MVELLERPNIRDNFEDNDVWMNKMTDEELDQFDSESRQMCIEEGIEEKYPDINASILSKHIDRGILYKLFQMSEFDILGF